MKKIKTLCGVLALLCVGMMPVSAKCAEIQCRQEV